MPNKSNCGDLPDLDKNHSISNRELTVIEKAETEQDQPWLCAIDLKDALFTAKQVEMTKVKICFLIYKASSKV